VKAWIIAVGNELRDDYAECCKKLLEQSYSGASLVEKANPDLLGKYIEKDGIIAEILRRIHLMRTSDDELHGHFTITELQKHIESILDMDIEITLTEKFTSDASTENRKKFMDTFGRSDIRYPFTEDESMDMIAFTYFALVNPNKFENKLKSTNHCHIVIGPSGVGKTHALFSRACETYMIYIMCRPKDVVSEFFQPEDYVFRALLNGILCSYVSASMRYRTDNALMLFTKFVIARVLYLMILLRKIQI
jgi:hypothetical protein